MSPQFSLYLDLARFVAALAVFISHFALHRLSGGELWRLNAYGAEAVTFFFVMSGYVIAYTSSTRENTASSYALSRCARMYSVALPAVLLTALLDTLGERISPERYFAGWGYVHDLSLQRFFAALSFTNEVWSQEVFQGSNAAYWSLGYEVPFYIVFGLALFTPPRWRVAAVALALLVAGPAIAVAFPIWLAGWAAYHYGQRARLAPRTGLWLFGLSLLAWLAYEVATARLGRPYLTPTILFKRHELLQDYILAPIFVLNLIGFQAAASTLGAPLQRYAGAIRWLAGATFTLYLCHLPVAQFLLACSPWAVGDMRSNALVLCGTLALVFLLAEVTERRESRVACGFAGHLAGARGALNGQKHGFISLPFMTPTPYYSSGRPAWPRGSWLVAALLGLAAAAFHAAHGMQLAHSVLMQSFNWVFDFDSSRFLGGWCTPGADVARDFDIAFVPRHALALAMRPLCLALQPLSGDPGAALMLLTAACAGGVVAMAYALAASLCEAEFDRILLALGFGLSVQPLMLGVIPETFGFAMMGLCLHFALLAKQREGGPLTGPMAVLSLFLNLGFTVTNAGLNLISAAVMGWRRISLRPWLGQQLRVWLLAGAALLIVTLAAAWTFAPGLLGLAGSAPQRVWWVININRGEPASLLMVLCTFFLYSFVAPALSIVDLAPSEAHLMADFRAFNYGWTGGVALALWCAAMLASIWLASRERDTRRLLVTVGLWLLFNVLLHWYWQYRGSVYLYGAHTAPALFAVLCMGYGAALRHCSSTAAPLVRAAAVLMLALAAVNNYGVYGSMIEFVLQHSVRP